MTDVGRANRLVECDAVASADTISIDLDYGGVKRKPVWTSDVNTNGFHCKANDSYLMYSVCLECEWSNAMGLIIDGVSSSSPQAPTFFPLMPKGMGWKPKWKSFIMMSMLSFPFPPPPPPSLISSTTTTKSERKAKLKSHHQIFHFPFITMRPSNIIFCNRKALS